MASPLKAIKSAGLVVSGKSLSRLRYLHLEPFDLGNSGSIHPTRKTGTYIGHPFQVYGASMAYIETIALR